MNKIKNIIRVLIMLIIIVSIGGISYATPSSATNRIIEAMLTLVQFIIFGIVAIWFLFKICKWIIRLIVYKKKIRNRR